MSTESFTRKIVLGKEACKKLIDMMDNPQSVPEHLLDSTEYEEGIRILEQYYGHSNE